MSTTNTLEDRLNADFAPAWKPDPDGLLIGEVVELSERDGGYGSYPIVTVKQDNGEVLAAHAFHTVLSSQLAEQRPAIGERIGIRYKGKVDGGGTHGAYHGYVVRVDRPAGASIDWAKYGESADIELPGPAAPAATDRTPLAVGSTPAATADDEDIPF